MGSSRSERDLTAAERKWLARLRRVVAAQPDSLVIYCHGSSTSVLDRELYEAADDRNLTEAVLEEANVIETSGWIAGDF